MLGSLFNQRNFDLWLGSLGPINQECVKAHISQQLHIDNKALSYLPFVLSDKDSNITFTVFKALSPSLFAILNKTVLYPYPSQ